MNKLYAIKTLEAASNIKRMMVLLLIISLALLSETASSNQLSTINELTAEYNSESCIECHEVTHKGWKRSWHGKSVIDPRVLKTWRTFILSGLDKSEGSRRDLKDICLPCHAPQTKDASDDLVREIAGMIITAVEEIDSYGSEDEAVPAETKNQNPSLETEDTITSFVPANDLTIIDIKNEFKIENTITAQDFAISDSPWIRKDLDIVEDIAFGLFDDKPSPGFIENKSIDETGDISAASDHDMTMETPEGAVLGEDGILVAEETPPLKPFEDFTVSFVEDGETPLKPAVEVEEMTATMVVDNGKVKIEYSPYDPTLDLKEPVFLDKGVTMGEIAVEELSKLNINCMICHSMKALPGGNPRPRTIYATGSSGSIEHKKALGAETRISNFMKTSEFCAQCHHGCPPGMPSSICPTLWTSYKEDYVARGGDKTCQNCHMNGADKKSHRFPGIYETALVEKGITLTLDAEPTRHIYHLENRIVPAVIINVKITNTAGHGIPHGCTYIPQTAMQVFVTDQNGNELFFKNKIYEVYNLHLPQNSKGYLGLNDWDITAMNRVNLGIDPGDTDSNTYVVPLNEDTTSVIIEAVFKYLYEEGVSTVIHKKIKEIEFEIEKKSPRM